MGFWFSCFIKSKKNLSTVNGDTSVVLVMFWWLSWALTMVLGGSMAFNQLFGWFIQF